MRSIYKFITVRNTDCLLDERASHGLPQRLRAKPALIYGNIELDGAFMGALPEPLNLGLRLRNGVFI